MQSNQQRRSYDGHEMDVVDLDEDDREDNYDDDDEDEHIIVTMLRSMNSKKLEAGQLKDMKLEVDVEKLRQDIKLEFFKGIQSKQDEKIELEWRARQVKFDRLFNKIIAKKMMLDKENALVL